MGALQLVLLALPSAALAFSAVPSAPVRRSLLGRAAIMAADDPTANPFVQAINVLQEAIQSSPIATFKKELAKLQAGSYDPVQTRAEIDSMLAANPAVVFSFTTCPFCIKAKQLLDETGASYKAVELNVIPNGYALRAELAGMTGRTSVPAVFIKGQFAGGCNDGGMGGVITLNSQGRLRTMLADAGALA
jgi:glutaredoxin 3